MNGWDILCLIVGIIWIGTIFVGIFELSRMPKSRSLNKEEYVKKSDIVDMYENDFPTLDDGVHWSRSDIISNLDSIPSYSILPIEDAELQINDEDETVSEFYNKLPEEKQETITAFVKAAISKQDKIDSRYIECFKTKFTDKEKDITYYLVGSAIEKEWSEVNDNE